MDKLFIKLFYKIYDEEFFYIFNGGFIVFIVIIVIVKVSKLRDVSISICKVNIVYIGKLYNIGNIDCIY